MASDEPLSQSKLRLLYRSLETILNTSVWEVLCQLHVKSNALVLDEAHRLIQWGDAYHRLGEVQASLLAHKPEESRVESGASVMKRYLFTRRCRWQVLLEEFGFGDEAKGMVCGECDRCRQFAK